MSRALLPAAALLLAAASPARFTAPLQPWRSADGEVALLRPAAAHVPAPALKLPATWRLSWNGMEVGPGQLETRLALDAGQGAIELLQVGLTRDPATAWTCLRTGISAAHVERLPDRTLGGTRFLAWRNTHTDAGTTTIATDLRAIVGGTCYAADRVSIAPAGAAPAPTRAAALLDAALASLRVGAAAAHPARPPHLRLPPGAVAR